MDKTVFLKKLSEILDEEPNSITEYTTFAELDGFDSFATLSIIALADDELGITSLKGEDIQGLHDIQELINLIGRERFDT